MRGIKDSNRGKDRGVVLLTTLLIMSLMATLAVAIIDDVRFGFKRAVNVAAQGQTDWYAAAAKDFAQSYLEEQIQTVSGQDLNAYLSVAEPTFLPLDNGFISLTIRDGSQCFSLAEVLDSAGPQQFSTLLNVLGIEVTRTASLTAALVDWQDEGSQIQPNGAEDYTYLGLTPPYRTANVPMTSAMELRALSGMTEDIYQAVRPYICARPIGESSVININTLPVEKSALIASLIGEENIDVARRLLAERPSGGYESEDQLRASPILQGIDLSGIDFSNLVYAPEYIWVEADVFNQDTRRFIAMEFSVAQSKVSLVSVYLSRDARRPEIKPLAERTPT